MLPRKSPGDNGADIIAQSESANSELSLIANLLALGLVQGRPQEEQIVLLGAAGYPAGKIATLLGTTRNTVSVTLSRKRSAAKAKTKSKR